MANSQLAPRRLPFQIGTTTVFVQAAPPAGWIQEVINDRFLRVVSAGGGVTAGPDNATTNSVDLAHSHTIPSHDHTMGTHTHDATHNHNLPDDTIGMVDFTYSSIEGGAAAYDVKDNSDGFDDIFHIRVDGGANNEGQHDHEIAGVVNGSVTGTSTGDTIASPDSTLNTSGTSDPASVSMVHTHTVASNFRPRYKDVIIARAVN